MSRKLFFTMVLSAFLMLTGCKSDSQNAKDVAYNFLTAMDKHDKVAVNATLTKKAQEQPLTQDFLNSDNKSDTVENNNYTLGQVTIQNDLATVAVDLKDSKGETAPGAVQLRREGGAWKVYALSFQKDGNSFTLDFENPERIIGDLFQAVGKEMGKASTALIKGMEGFVKGLNEGMKDAPK
jgi:Protein of unknown function (DUF3828)